MIKKQYTHYLGKIETDHATRFECPVSVYKSDEIDKKLKILLDELRTARHTILDLEKDLDINLDKEDLLKRIRKIEQLLSEAENKVFSEFK